MHRARTMQHAPCKVFVYWFTQALLGALLQALRHKVVVQRAVLGSLKRNPVYFCALQPSRRHQELTATIQKVLKTIHKPLRTPAIVLLRGPLHRVKSPEISARCAPTSPSSLHILTACPLA